MLLQMGSWSRAHSKAVIVAWVVVLIGLWGAAGALGSGFSDDLEVPDSETRRGFDTLDTYFGGIGGGLSGSIVFSSPQGIEHVDVTAAMNAMFEQAAQLDGMTLISPYAPDAFGQINDDRTVAYASIDLDPDLGETEGAELGLALREMKPTLAGLTVLIGGQSLAGFEPPESELIGIAFAIVILIVAFGSVIAMGIPIGVALIGVGTGLGATTLASNLISIPQFALTIGAMIGLGVGIDYALFVITRYREYLHLGLDGEYASRAALNTAGRAVVFAGITVVVSLLGLVVIGLSFVIGLAVSAAATVLFTMLASITLLPALLGAAGERIETTKWRGALAAGLVAVALLGVGLGVPFLLVGFPAAIVVLIAGSFVPKLRTTIEVAPPKELRESGWYRFSRVIQAKPWTSALAGTIILLVLAAPVLSLRLGFSDEGNAPPETDHRQAYDLLAEGFGPGFNGPLIATAEVDGQADFAALAGVVEAVNADPGVVAAFGPIPNDSAAPAAALIQVIPSTAPQDEDTEILVARLREVVIPTALGTSPTEVNLTGFTAASIDFTNYLAGRTLLFFGVVLVLSFLLLMVVFRSLLVPLKAVVMNMLSIGAAYGVVVAAFQWGWLDAAFDTGHGTPIEPFIPMMMFAIVFGLSMDYEVFLLSRIKEEYDRSGDAVGSVADGLAATARVITAAAAIMVVVFGSFVFEADRVVRLFGFGLAIAVFIDATLVRMVLVPATMELLGERNWWIPAWLDRLLPNVQIEGSGRLSDEETDAVGVAHT